MLINGFMDPMNTLMEQMILFHDHVMSIIMMITVFLFYIMGITMNSSYLVKMPKSFHLLELIWTIIPGMILLLVAMPSLHLLYLTEEASTTLMTLKVTGHQWYWSYEYDNQLLYKLDSYLSLSDSFRLLQTINWPLLPSMLYIKVLITSSDVIHSWAVPALGVKVDAVPGRINMIPTINHMCGILYGQCSEICGAYHSFSPIMLEFVPLDKFLMWYHQE